MIANDARDAPCQCLGIAAMFDQIGAHHQRRMMCLGKICAGLSEDEHRCSGECGLGAAPVDMVCRVSAAGREVSQDRGEATGLQVIACGAQRQGCRDRNVVPLERSAERKEANAPVAEIKNFGPLVRRGRGLIGAKCAGGFEADAELGRTGLPPHEGGKTHAQQGQVTVTADDQGINSVRDPCVGRQ